MTVNPRFLAAPPASLPSSRNEIVASPKAIDALNSVSRVFFPHEVVVRDRSGRIDFNHCLASIGDISLNQIAYGADVDVLINQLQRSLFVLVIALSGTATVEFNRQSRRLDKGDCVLMAPDVRYRFQMGQDHSHLAIGIPCQRLSGCGRPYEDVHSIADRAGDGPQGGAAHLMAFIEYLCAELHEGSPLFGLSAVTAAHESCFLALMRAALFEEEGRCLPAAVLPGFVRRADRFICDHLKDDIGLDDIVSATGVPVRTLYHGFDRFLGHSPMRWLKLRRLESARAEMIASKGEISVIALANQYWIGHSGQHVPRNLRRIAFRHAHPRPIRLLGYREASTAIRIQALADFRGRPPLRPLARDAATLAALRDLPPSAPSCRAIHGFDPKTPCSSAGT
jgi:AraC-like DNA-binding protein